MSTQLEQRKEIFKRYSEALQTKTKEEEELNKTKQKNEEFVSALKKLEDSAQPLCSFFGVATLNEKNRLKVYYLHKEGRFLPSLLYNVYGKLIGYIVSSKKSIAVDIEDAGPELSTYYEKNKEEKNLHNPFMKVVNKSKFGKSIIGKMFEKGLPSISKTIHKLKKKEKPNEEIQKNRCPLSLILTIKETSYFPKFPIESLHKLSQAAQDLLPLSINFYYQCNKCITIAQASNTQFSSEEILTSLFISKNEEYKDDGVYEWAQVFSGSIDYKEHIIDGIHLYLHNEAAANSAGQTNEISTNQLFIAIAYRLSSLISLQHQIGSLHDKNEIAPEIGEYLESSPTFSIFKIRSEIKYFDLINKDDYIKITGCIDANKSDRFYSMHVKCSSYTLIAYIKISPNYYIFPPTFTLKLEPTNCSLDSIPNELLLKCDSNDVKTVSLLSDPYSGYAQALHVYYYLGN